MRRNEAVFRLEQRVIRVIGSLDTTSSPAAYTLPELSASARSCSTTSGPRLLLIMMTPSFIFEIVSRLIIPASLRKQRAVQRHDVGTAQKLIQFHVFGDLRTLDAAAAVERYDVHPQRLGNTSYVLPDAPGSR